MQSVRYTNTYHGWSGEENAWSVGSAPHYTFMLSRAALALRFETRNSTDYVIVECKPLQRECNYLTPSPQPKKILLLDDDKGNAVPLNSRTLEEAKLYCPSWQSNSDSWVIQNITRSL